MTLSRLKWILSGFDVWMAGLLMICLPVTSSPLIQRLTGSSMVAPLALLPLGILIVAWYIPFLLRAGRLPLQSLPLLAFVAVALLSTLLAFFSPVPSYHSASLLKSSTEGLATLGIGILFYLVVTAWAVTSQRLAFMLRWLNWSGVIIIAVSLLQVGLWYRLRMYPAWLWDVQSLVTTSGTLFVQRASGLAYEPSWLAHQLNMLYLPYWLAAAVSGYTAHGWRAGRIQFELLLLLAGVSVLLLSVSRVGLLAFLLMLAYLLLWANIRLVRWLQDRLTRKFPAGERHAKVVRFWFGLASLVVLVVVYSGMLAGAAYGLSRYDERMARMFDLTSLREQSLFHYANQLVFAERIVFWQAGWNVFNDHPLLGVGLGNAGYYFPQALNPFSYALSEVRILLYRLDSLPNIKSLWVRVLAETGIVGFAFFASWCFVLWQTARFLIQRRERLSITMGLAGSFALVGLIIEGFSIDTFALPYFWVTLALVTAACETARCASGRGAAGIGERG
jgi:O-antigen ligase